MARKGETNKMASGKTRDPTLLVDPRRGDIEDDASSTKRRSMLSLFGSMLVEISLPKLLVAWALLLVLPGLLLGLAPIVFVEWLTVVTDKLASLVIGLWSILILAGLIALGWFGWRALFRTAEPVEYTLRPRDALWMNTSRSNVMFAASVVTIAGLGLAFQSGA